MINYSCNCGNVYFTVKDIVGKSGNIEQILTCTGCKKEWELIELRKLNRIAVSSG